MQRGRSSLRFLVLALGLAAFSCSDDNTAKPAAGATSFESDLPAGSEGAGPTRGGDNESAADGAASGAPPLASTPRTPQSSTDKGGEAERAIVEADIIQVRGNTLYALSKLAGLAIIDISEPSALRLLGRYRELPAEPFELYLRDDVALVMFTGWGQYEKLDDGEYSFVSTSKLLALDVSDAANVSLVSSFDVPGTISDSRMVGDVLYIVGYQNGYCYRCEQSKPRSSIVSLAVTNPRAVTKIGELFYDDAASNGYSGQKSITVTNQRMYIGGPEYSQDGPTGSTIQVVDISSPTGELVEGTTVKVAGEISSRWQMDEYAGVLRVISQPQPTWTQQGQQLTTFPSVQTFKVESSNKLTPLGQTEIQLPLRETLRSARFDGERAYAITALQQDPLFTIDLSDPAHPRQMAEIVMPGFIWHMEPRGERLIGLGFDQGNPAGGLTVTLFDVKDLSAPKLLSRANFGGSWGYLPEDQDRAHKLFRVLDDAGLIFVPFSGWNDSGVDSQTASGQGCRISNYVGGVQIIDFKDDVLKARGAAPSTGQARRAFLQQDQLLTVSDERVESFDISDRDAPQRTSQVVLARQIYQALQLDNDVVARLSYESGKGQPTLDFVAAASAGDPNQSYGELDIATAAGGTADALCGKSLSIDQALVHGSELDLLYSMYANDGNGQTGSVRGVLVIDASNPAAPVIRSDTHWSNDDNWSVYSSFYRYGYYNASLPVVRTARALTMLETSWTYTPVSSTQNVRLRVLDLRDPAHVTTTTLPFDKVASYSGLLADGDSVLTSHLTGSETDPKRARFYIDRFDVSNPTAPRQLASVNVPGALLHFDSATQRAITSEQSRRLVPDVTYEECSTRFAYSQWNTPNNGGASSGGVAVALPSRGGAPTVPATPTEPPPPPPTGLCEGFVQSLHLVHVDGDVATLEDTVKLDENQQVSSSSMGDGVVFATIGRGGLFYRGGPAIDIACAGPCGGGPTQAEPAELLVLGAFGSGKLAQGHIRVEDPDAVNAWSGFWGTPPVYAHGKRALLVGQADVAIIDASDPSNPEITKRVPLIASAGYVDVREDTALLTLGAQGVQWLPLD